MFKLSPNNKEFLKKEYQKAVASGESVVEIIFPNTNSSVMLGIIGIKEEISDIEKKENCIFLSQLDFLSEEDCYSKNKQPILFLRK
ncbi:MAG: hypothetical protein ACI9AR_000443 [Flavobacteriaceae bacterium]|jgi:hypothetical protein